MHLQGTGKRQVRHFPFGNRAAESFLTEFLSGDH
jgi:hypothetical protein